MTDMTKAGEEGWKVMKDRLMPFDSRDHFDKSITPEYPKPTLDDGSDPYRRASNYAIQPGKAKD